MTRITKGSSIFAPSDGEWPPPPSTRRAKLSRRAGAATAAVTVAAIAAIALATDSEDKAVDRPLAAEHGRSQAAGGPVEEPARTSADPPTCVWTSQVDVPVFPAEVLGGPPTPESILIFERCDREWTGDIAWLNAGPQDMDPEPPDESGISSSVERWCASSRPDTGGGPSGPATGASGFVNPWAAGDAAVARYLNELCRQAGPR